MKARCTRQDERGGDVAVRAETPTYSAGKPSVVEKNEQQMCQKVFTADRPAALQKPEQ